MASGGLIALAVGAGGVAAFVIYKAWKAKQGSSVCAGACNGNKQCLAACNAAASLVGDIGSGLDTLGGDLDPGDSFDVEVSNRNKNNAALNGASTIPNVMRAGGHLYPLTGDTLQYANGCQPFDGAPGFSKCATGTKSMYADAVDAAVGNPFGLGGAALVMNQASTVPVTTSGANVERSIVKANFLTGLAGDPTTFGPWGNGATSIDLAQTNADVQSTAAALFSSNVEEYQVVDYPYDGYDVKQPGPNGVLASVRDYYEETSLNQTASESATGPLTWLVKGKRIACASGSVPKSVYLAQQFGLANTDAEETCVDANGLTTACVGNAAPPGFTWDTSGGAGHWRRLNQGELVNNGPCAPVSTSTQKTINEGLQTLSNVLGTNHQTLGAHGTTTAL